MRDSLPPILTDVIDSMHDGLFLVSPDGVILMANDALLRITGFSRDEIEGKTCAVFRCEECEQHRNRSSEHWCELFAAGSGIRQYCHFFTKDGRRLNVLKSSKVVRNDQGEIIASVANVTDLGDLLEAEHRIVEMERHFHGEDDFCGMVGNSPGMRRLYGLVEKAAMSDAAVIIYGESGVGKELVAHAIHRLGPRRDKPFVQINCAAFNESLLESELFGHVRGAYTGALRDRVGRFEQVQGGDLFFDEVGDIPLPTQVKLLRVLETRTFERVGDNRQLPMDARLISATHQNLERLSRELRFRRDFYFRINVVPLHIPPLRERREDIPLLVDRFVGRLRDRTGRDVAGLSPAAMNLLLQYDWPGNVRELRSALEYAFVVCPTGIIAAEHLPVLGSMHPGVNVATSASTSSALDASAHDTAFSAADHVQRTELIAALRASGGNKSAAARLLGVTRLTVLNRMRKYGVEMRGIRFA